MNNFCSAPHFIIKPHISPSCELYLDISQGKLTMLNKRCYQDKPASIEQLSNSSVASNGQALANKFLANQSEDKFDFLHYFISIYKHNAIPT
jgi:hypothetical protein